MSSPGYKTWRIKRRKTIDLLRKLSYELDRMEKDVDISKLTGTSAAIVSGIGTIGCLLAVPFTGGASALGIIGFAGLGIAGGTVNIGAAIGKHFHEKDLIEKVQRALDDDRLESKRFNLEEFNIPIGKAIIIGKEAVTTAKAAAGPALSVIKATSKAIAVANLALLPLDVFNLIETAIKVDDGSINKSARKVQRIAEELEEELESFGG